MPAPGKSDADVRALCDLADEHQACLDVTLRACRYPHRVRGWKAICPAAVRGATKSPVACVRRPAQRS